MGFELTPPRPPPPASDPPFYISPQTGNDLNVLLGGLLGAKEQDFVGTQADFRAPSEMTE